MQLYSPKLRLAGEGYRNRDGTFHIVARGRQATYGPLRMVLDGHIERPHVELFLDRPNDTLGIRDMRLLAGSDRRRLRLSCQRPVATGAVHEQRTDPPSEGRSARSSPSPRSTSMARERTGTFAPIPAVSRAH